MRKDQQARDSRVRVLVHLMKQDRAAAATDRDIEQELHRYMLIQWGLSYNTRRDYIEQARLVLDREVDLARQIVTQS